MVSPAFCVTHSIQMVSPAFCATYSIQMVLLHILC